MIPIASTQRIDRSHRHEIFDDDFQSELESMYRDTGAGSDPVPPAQMAMALLMQGYLGLSDADAVEATVLDLRWQLVLECLGTTDPPFSQGTLQGFRERLIAHDMDKLEFFGRMAPHATGGVYVNFMPEDEAQRVSRGAYGSNYERLARLKAKYDPRNLFQRNQNTRPAA